MTPAKIPIYLLTGFLGAGKTRLFQRISTHPPFDCALIIVNEFGETSIDDFLMVNQKGQAEALAGGCVCCTSRNELLTTIQIALQATTPPSAIVIETTGLASPHPILTALAGHQMLAERLDFRVITVIDATTAMSLMKSQITAQEQLALADAVVLTKTDLMDEGSALAAIAPFIQQLNPLAGITHSADQNDGDLAHWLENIALHKGFDHPEKAIGAAHIGTIRSTTLRYDGAVTPQMLEAFLFEASRQLGASLLRLKGFARLEGAAAHNWLVQMVQGVISPPESRDFIPLNADTLQIVAIADDVVLARLRLIFDGIFGKGAIDTPDAQALRDNPLSIAGF